MNKSSGVISDRRKLKSNMQGLTCLSLLKIILLAYFEIKSYFKIILGYLLYLLYIFFVIFFYNIFLFYILFDKFY